MQHQPKAELLQVKNLGGRVAKFVVVVLRDMSSLFPTIYYSPSAGVSPYCYLTGINFKVSDNGFLLYSLD